MASWGIGFRSISGPIRPDRPIVIAIPHEIALADGANQSYYPYVRFGYGRSPWTPALSGHKQAMEQFAG